MENTIKRLERRVRALTIALCAMPLLLVGLGMGGTLSNIVCARLRAQSLEVWDKERAGLVLNVEDTLRGHAGAISRLGDRLKIVEDVSSRAYSQSGAKAIDEKAAAHEAALQEERKTRDSLVAELAGIRREITEATRQASTEAERQKWDELSKSGKEERDAEALRKEIMRLRKAIQEGY